VKNAGKFIACFSLAIGLALSANGNLVPTHRYSFASNGNATDVYGTANGTANGGATFTTNGVVLDGISGYVSLPPGAISNLTAVTMESWVTFGTITNNSYIFSFGTTDLNGAGADYIFCTPHGNGTRAVVSGSDPGWQAEQGAVISSTLDNQTNVMVATVFNPSANNICLYLNGVLVANNTNVTTSLASVSDQLSYIGKSLYTGDPYLKGTINEFRIYNSALPYSQIAVDAAAGAGRIVPSTGNLVSIAVSATNMTVNSTQLPAVTGKFANVQNVNLFGYGQPVIISANTNIATVSAAGVITAVVPGTVVITASYGGFTNTSLISVTFPTNLFIYDTFSDGFWTITNALDGRPLTASANGATQENFTYGASDQQFELLYNYQNSSFRIRQHSSWLCLGAANGGTNAGASVTTVNYSATASQQWYLVPAGGGLYHLINLAGDYALQTDNGNPANVTLAGASTNAGQFWGVAYQTHYPKKGCAGYEGDYSQFGLSWAYNYNDNTGVGLPGSVDFVPMIYSAQYWEPLSDAQSRDSGWLNQPSPAYLLAYNEPDNASQSNTSTNGVLSIWPQIQALNIPIVSPAVQNTFDAWEYNFFSLVAKNGYRVDYAAAHEYVPPNSSSLLSQLNSIYNTWGRPVWLTEFSPVDWNGNQGWTEDDDYNFLAEFMWLAEGNEWLKRYAIFPFSGSNPLPPYQSTTAGYRGNFFLADGATLAPYGELYAAWDGNTTLQTRTPYLIHNLGTSFRLTSTNTAATPQAATIYTRNASAQWALLASPTANQYYIISLKDGRRLRNNGGSPDLAPYGTTGTAVQWWMNGPDSKGYYYIDNLSASQSIRATGTAPAISFSMINDPAPSTATQWRLVKPYQPVSITTPAPPAVAVSYSKQAAMLAWTGNGVYYNIYRSLTSGGGYGKIASLVTGSTYTDSTVQNGQPYYYVLTSLNILGEESGFSTEMVARPSSTSPQALTFLPVNNSGQNGIQFNWTADHIGWRLMMNTNGLSRPNWITISNSAATNQIWLPFDPTQTSAFFQLIYP
jgi:hypothetical protein